MHYRKHTTIICVRDSIDYNLFGFLYFSRCCEETSSLFLDVRTSLLAPFLEHYIAATPLTAERACLLMFSATHQSCPVYTRDIYFGSVYLHFCSPSWSSIFHVPNVRRTKNS